MTAGNQRLTGIYSLSLTKYRDMTSRLCNCRIMLRCNIKITDLIQIQGILSTAPDRGTGSPGNVHRAPIRGTARSREDDPRPGSNRQRLSSARYPITHNGALAYLEQRFHHHGRIKRIAGTRSVFQPAPLRTALRATASVAPSPAAAACASPPDTRTCRPVKPARTRSLTPFLPRQKPYADRN